MKPRELYDKIVNEAGMKPRNMASWIIERADKGMPQGVHAEDFLSDVLGYQPNPNRVAEAFIKFAVDEGNDSLEWFNDLGGDEGIAEGVFGMGSGYRSADEWMELFEEKTNLSGTDIMNYVVDRLNSEGPPHPKDFQSFVEGVFGQISLSEEDVVRNFLELAERKKGAKEGWREMADDFGVAQRWFDPLKFW